MKVSPPEPQTCKRTFHYQLGMIAGWLPGSLVGWSADWPTDYFGGLPRRQLHSILNLFASFVTTLIRLLYFAEEVLFLLQEFLHDVWHQPSRATLCGTGNQMRNGK